jgi:ABC-type glycerol-3-phosphate transport system permease component
MLYQGNPYSPRKSWQQYLPKVFLYLSVLVFLFIVLSPFFWIVKSSLSKTNEVFTAPPNLSASYHL